MECQVCNSETKINWGNANIVLCETHSNELEKLIYENINPKNNKDWKPGILEKIILIAACLSLAAFSLPFVALSAMAFDSGFSWAAALFVGSFSLIPISLIIFSIYILFK